jgi:hypothetical protein
MSNQRVGVAVRSVLNEFVGRANTSGTRIVAKAMLWRRLQELGYPPDVAREKADRGIEVVLG